MDEKALTCASTCRLRQGGQGTGGAGSPRGWQRQGWVGGSRWGAWGRWGHRMSLGGGGAVRAPRGGLSSARHSLCLAVAANTSVLLGLPAPPRRRRRDPHTLSCGAAGGGRSGQCVLPMAGRRVGRPARAFPRGGFGTGQGFGACGPAAGPGGGLCLPCEEVPFLTSKMEAGGFFILEATRNTALPVFGACGPGSVPAQDWL